jgi:predicted nucleic acid-binding protein
MRQPFIDTNIILDVFLQNEGLWEESAAILKLCETGIITGSISLSSVTDLFYIIKKHTDMAGARKALDYILTVFDILNVDKDDLAAAYNLPISDFEDALQSWCAIKAGSGVIITRNTGDFANSTIPATSPGAYIQMLISNPVKYGLTEDEAAFIKSLAP